MQEKFNQNISEKKEAVILKSSPRQMKFGTISPLVLRISSQDVPALIFAILGFYVSIFFLQYLTYIQSGSGIRYSTLTPL